MADIVLLHVKVAQAGKLWNVRWHSYRHAIGHIIRHVVGLSECWGCRKMGGARQGTRCINLMLHSLPTFGVHLEYSKLDSKTEESLKLLFLLKRVKETLQFTFFALFSHQLSGLSRIGAQ